MTGDSSKTDVSKLCALSRNDFRNFVASHLVSFIVFIDVQDSASSKLLARLEAMASFFSATYGFGYVDTSAAVNQDLCKEQDVIVSPNARFYVPDQRVLDDQWIGIEQIVELATREELARKFRDASGNPPDAK